MKVFESVLEKRLCRIVTVDELQFGFMPERGTIDAVFIFRRPQEEHHAKGKRLYMCFVDIEKAIDRVPRKVMGWALRKNGMPEVLVGSAMSLNENAECFDKSQMDTELSEEFEVNVGMHRGSVLSPFLFAVVVYIITEFTREGALSELLYADDLVMMSETIEGLRNKFIKWKEIFESKCLKVNLGKADVVVSGGITYDGMSKSKVYPCGSAD